jgi:hypothetical protein
MLRLTKLSYYYRQLRRSARKGELELEALDVNRDNRLTEIPIPMNGYILKPNEVYVCEAGHGEGVLSAAALDPKLKALGVSVEIINERQFVLTVKRPIRVYEEMDIFTSFKQEIPLEHDNNLSRTSSKNQETPS